MAARRFDRGLLIQYGVEEHFKNPCDQLFSVLNGVTKGGAKQRDLTDVVDVVKCWSGRTPAGKVGLHNRPAPAVHVEEFWPPPKNEVQVFDAKPSSMGAPITHCYSWEFTIADKRQASVIGEDGTTATKINVKPRMVPGESARPGVMRHPCLRRPRAVGEAPAGEGVEEEEEEEGPPPEDRAWKQFGE